MRNINFEQEVNCWELIKAKYNKNNALQQKIQYIWQMVLKFKMIAINKHRAKPKYWCFKMPNAPYLNRYHTLKTKE